MVYSTHYQYFMQGDGFPDDLDLAATIQIPRFGVGQKIFRRYTLQKVIGRGGMGVVWLAQDAYLDSLVALKVLPDTLLHDSASLDSLKRETKMGLSLAHPNIVRIYDFQHDESSAAISMEYVDGGTLSDLRIKRPDKIFNPQDLTDWLEALFDGLDYAHTRKQIVHRDLKPRNLMLTSRGELKIADFGISRCISDSVTLLTGMIGSSGTPPYISPQQWDGERPTPLDDIYSLGATLYELLSSKPPLLGVVDWHQVHHRVAPPISQRRIEFGIKGADPIPQHWEETVAACLAKDPAKRPQTIRELEGRLLVDNLESTTTLGKLPGAPPQETPAPVAESNLEKPVEISLRDTSSGLAEISSSPLPARNPAIPVMQAGEPGATSQAKLPADSSFERPVNDPVAATSQAVADNAARTAHPSQPKWVRMLRDAFSDKQGKIPLLVGLGVAAILLILLISLPNRTPRDLVIPAPSSAAFGDLTVESDPIGATIRLNEGEPLKAPHTYSNLKFGRHRIVASLEGYLATEKELEFKEGDFSKVILTLAKDPNFAKHLAAPSFAELSVRSEPPGASILVDGNPPGKLPDTFTELALGKHQLTATLEGYEPIQQELKIDVPNPEPLVIGLKPFGNLTIESEPPGAMIALDGGTPVKAPNTFSDVTFGRHKLSASLEGYLTAQQELDLKKGDSQKIVLKLAKKPPSFAKLSVRSEPPGASILVDGNPPDKPPDTFTRLALGKHQLAATLEGYEPIQQELKIDVPNPEPLVIGLKPFGNLTIESEPPGAMIALDGGTPVKAPNTFSDVTFGRHKLSASLEGYLTAQQELDLKKGDSQKIVLKLAKKPPSFAKLSVRSEPPGASILVDGNRPDKPPDTFSKLALGKHQLTATLEGYEPVQQELKIDLPNPEALVIGLKPFGNLTIESEPSGAMIALDGGTPVKAPNTFSDVTFGRHKLSASLEGYLTAQQELDLKKGDSQKIALKLAKKPPSFAKLSVRSEPPGASILVDGNPPDKPPDTFTRLALGKHQLAATLEGYEPIQQELKIDVPNPEPLVIRLMPFGDLTIESEPPGAMIALDGGTPVKAPNTFSSVKFGRHTLSASLEGYLIAQQELDLKKGDSQKIALKLAKKPPSFAKLSVRSEPPGASIFVDGNPPDKPPDTFTKLALGKHQLTATLAGYEPVQQELKIDVPNPEPLVIGLKPFGDLTIESEPPGAMIALDGEPPVKAPNTFSDVTFGRHKLSASLEGYLTAQQELDLKKGDSQKIVLKLAKKPPSFAKLSVRSEPPGASILVDGNPPDKPPDTFTKLALGKHQLTATLEGYEPVQQELKIDVPNPEPLVIGLKPFGNLTIESEPPGAMIALDGGTPVKAPNTFSNVKFGRHTLSASLEGYLTAQQELDLKKGDSQKIVLKLAKKPPTFAKLSVRSEPPGASILVDGNPPDKPPDTFSKLALGKHQLTATLEGYEPVQQELKLDVPNPEPLVIGLKPFGDLTIESEPPGAMIALDGGTPVKAPNTFSNVKFGRHTLSASLEGYLTAQQELDLKKGDSQKIALKLAKKPPTFAKLSVRSEPPGASILVDGNPPDKPPDTFTKLALGKHQLTATLEGYEPVQQELKIDLPNPEPLVIGLKPFGNLTIESEPPGAMIALDGGTPVKAPNTFSNVKFGRHTLSASLEGYLTAQQELDLKKGDSQKIALKLAKKPPSFAKLSVRSEPPGASILVDGNPPDKPPDTFTKLALGKHQLTATLEGYEPVQQELKIDLPNPEPLVIGLKPFGDLTIESEPSGAMIALDGGTPVKAPNTFSDVTFGRHKLSASLEGYLTAQQELDLKKGDSQKIALKLAKKPPSFAKLSVRSEPPGASILVDGNPPDMPPDTFTKLALGKHQLTATLENYESVRQELKIDTANPDPLIIPLKHTQSFIRLQELVDQINSSKSAPDSPQHLNACVKYLQHLYLKGFPPSPELPPEELEKELEKIIERVRAHQSLLKPSLSRQEFQKYEEPIRVAAAQLGSLQALLMLAENEKEPSKKFKLFQDAALKNSPDAMMMLGIFSAKGVGEAAGKPNFEKALDWLKRASDAGNREAAAYYYDCFLFGDTTKKRSENDQKAAVESLEVLAKQGEAHAAVVLGEWSRRRASVAADSATRLKFYREADDWWKMAKGPREWRACFYLGALREMGSLNDDGKPTDADLKEARALYEEGASNEDVMCMFQLGRFIWDQSGGSRNSDQKKEALRYIRNAAVAGSEPAKTWLAKHADAR